MGGGAEQFGLIANLKTLLLPNCSLLLVDTISSPVSHCIIQQPWCFSLCLLWHLNTQPEEKTVHSHIQILRLLVLFRPTCEPSVGTMWVRRLVHVCAFMSMFAAWRENRMLVSSGQTDSPGPAGIRLKPPADIHTAAAGLIACLSSLKGKAAALFTPPLSAVVAERFSLISKCCFSSSGSASCQHLGLFHIFQCSCQIQQTVLIPACCLVWSYSIMYQTTLCSPRNLITEFRLLYWMCADMMETLIHVRNVTLVLYVSESDPPPLTNVPSTNSHTVFSTAEWIR